jgi:putative ABC transport system substrate-binding protein
MSIHRRTFITGGLSLSGALALAACGGASTGTSSTAASGSAGSAVPAGATTYKVGIIKFVDHPSLNQIETNVKAELDRLSASGEVVFEHEPYTFDGQADGSVLQQIATQLLDDKVDVIVPIATPAAQVVQSATEGTKLPVVFSAVSDPVTAGLVESMDAPGATITGTSDALNTDAIMDLIFAAKPDTAKVGLLYSNSEDASKMPIEDAKAYLDAKGVAYVEKTGTTTDEVSQAVDALLAENVEAVFTPTDNTIQTAELAFYEKLIKAGVPHYGGADSFALNGAFCGFGVDYAQLGVATADMVNSILAEGADPASTPVQTFDNGIATINTETCEALGLDLAEVKSAFEPYVTQIVEIVTGQEFEE